MAQKKYLYLCDVIDKRSLRTTRILYTYFGLSHIKMDVIQLKIQLCHINFDVYDNMILEEWFQGPIL